MRIKDVANLSGQQRFLYWITERHNIYIKKTAGEPKPWTDDEILQNYFFTNPYRENDKVTQWFRLNMRDPLKLDKRVLFAAICFRWFNLPQPTGEVLLKHRLHLKWNEDLALRKLRELRDNKQQIFTGAYMINSPPGKRKLEAIVERISNVWEDRSSLIKEAQINAQSPRCKMETLHKLLTKYPGIAGFMAYEVVCDLRYTYYLSGAVDKTNWCNPGPGCARGLYRVWEEDYPNKGNNATSPPLPKDWRSRMGYLLSLVNNHLRQRENRTKFPRFEMREVEHSLCEFDKYERARLGDGKMKRKYNGV